MGQLSLTSPDELRGSVDVDKNGHENHPNLIKCTNSKDTYSNL